MKKLICIATFILINFACLKCQSHISIYHISDDSLKSLFLEFIDAEKAYDYYTEDCMFFLHISCVDTSLYFILESGPSNQEHFISDSTVLKDESFDDIVLVEYDNHFFYTFVSNATGKELPLKVTNNKLYVKDLNNTPMIMNRETIFDDSSFESNMLIIQHNGKYEKKYHYLRTYGKKQ